jgi:hypothetical protein
MWPRLLFVDWWVPLLAVTSQFSVLGTRINEILDVSTSKWIGQYRANRLTWWSFCRVLARNVVWIALDTTFVLTVISSPPPPPWDFLGKCWDTTLNEATPLPSTSSPSHCSLSFNRLNTELNPICYLLTLLGDRHILHVSRIRVNPSTLYSGFLTSSTQRLQINY